MDSLDVQVDCAHWCCGGCCLDSHLSFSPAAVGLLETRVLRWMGISQNGHYVHTQDLLDLDSQRPPLPISWCTRGPSPCDWTVCRVSCVTFLILSLSRISHMACWMDFVLASAGPHIYSQSIIIISPQLKTHRPPLTTCHLRGRQVELLAPCLHRRGHISMLARWA